MSLLKIIAAMQQEAIKARTEEKEILQSIANITTVEFAEEAAEALDPKRHPYSFENYLVILKRLEQLLAAGMQQDLALDIAQTNIDIRNILENWRYENE